MKELKLELKKLESRETKDSSLCYNSGNFCSLACSMGGSPVCVI